MGEILDEEVERSVTTDERRCSSHPPTMTNGVAHHPSLPAAVAQTSSGASCSTRRERAPAGPSPCGSAHRADRPGRRIARSSSVGDRSRRHPRRDQPPDDGGLHDPAVISVTRTSGSTRRVIGCHGDEPEANVRSISPRRWSGGTPMTRRERTLLHGELIVDDTKLHPRDYLRTDADSVARAPSPGRTTARPSTRSRPSAKLTALKFTDLGGRANARQTTGLCVR